MTNSELLTVLKLVEIISRIAETKEDVTQYILEAEETLKKASR